MSRGAAEPAVTTAVVLGGGGLVGQAFHAGALAALEQDLGFDARHADVIVGTSAGAISGALLRLGLSPTDMAASFVGAPDSPWRQLGRELPSLPPMRWQDVLRLRLPTPELVARTLRLPWLRNPLAAWLAMVPDGSHDVREHLDFLDNVASATWPMRSLWITATRQRDGRRVVFGADDQTWPRLPDAVAASCAVPGYFEPIEIDGVRYVDGGVHSATNTDVLSASPAELVLVVSPLSTTAPVARSVDGLARQLATRRLRSEVAALEAGGRTVFVIEPGPEAVAAMGHDLLSSGACAGTVREAYLDLGRRATIAADATLHRRLGRRRAAA